MQVSNFNLKFSWLLVSSYELLKSSRFSIRFLAAGIFQFIVTSPVISGWCGFVISSFSPRVPGGTASFYRPFPGEFRVEWLKTGFIPLSFPPSVQGGVVSIHCHFPDEFISSSFPTGTRVPGGVALIHREGWLRFFVYELWSSWLNLWTWQDCLNIWPSYPRHDKHCSSQPPSALLNFSCATGRTSCSPPPHLYAARTSHRLPWAGVLSDKMNPTERGLLTARLLVALAGRGSNRCCCHSN